MIKLKHKQTGKEWNYSATVWFKRGYDINDYDILEWNDVVELFHDRSNKVSDGKMEKRDAIKIIDEQHYIGYWFEDIEKPLFKTDLNDKFLAIKDKSDSTSLSYEMTASQLVLLDALKLRDAGLLEKSSAINIPTSKQTTPHINKTTAGVGTAVVKIFKWTINKTAFIIMWVVIGILGTVIGGLLLICFINYFKNKGFSLQ